MDAPKIPPVIRFSFLYPLRKMSTGDISDTPRTVIYIRQANTHTNHIKKNNVTHLNTASLLLLFDATKKLETRRTIGKIYSKIPNTPKKNPLKVLPTIPPTPKLLINSRIQNATINQRMTSVRKFCLRSISCMRCFLLLFDLAFVEDEDFLVAIFPSVCIIIVIQR